MKAVTRIFKFDELMISKYFRLPFQFRYQVFYCKHVKLVVHELQHSQRSMLPNEIGFCQMLIFIKCV